jgi:outer membrane scaffolding protein for murein synthesis (MipA/OmpV family)
MTGLLMSLVTGIGVAEEAPGYWELGAGVSYLQSPYYLGSDESKNYVVPFPHIVVRTDKFSVDRNSVRGHILSTDRFKFDISFSGAFKVDSDDSRLRQGIPDLDYIIEGGPALKWLLKGEFNGHNRITLDMPVRAAVVTDFGDMEYIGWRILPTLHWHNVVAGNGVWTIDNRLRLMYATGDFHDYLYSVDAPYVTPQREYYQADGGFSGWQYRFTLRHRIGDRSIGFYLAYSNIADATYNDSPLVAENYNFSGGVFVSWVLGRGRF